MKARCYDYKPSFNVMKVEKLKPISLVRSVVIKILEEWKMIIFYVEIRSLKYPFDHRCTIHNIGLLE